MVKRLFLSFVLVFILISIPSFAGDVTIQHEGVCNTFNLTLNVSGFQPGAYDLKVENLGSGDLEIYGPKGWKSSFFYLKDYIEVSNNESKSLKTRIRYNSTDNLKIMGKLRNGSDKWESKKYRIEQNCPERVEPKENVSTEPNLTLSYEGNCKQYNITLTAKGFEEGIYDAKVNLKAEGESRSSGKIYDPEEGWKSSYYYIDNAFRIGSKMENKTLKVKTRSWKDLTVVGKLKKDSETWETDEHKVYQDCPDNSLNRIFVLLILLVTVLFLQVGIIIYIK